MLHGLLRNFVLVRNDMYIEYWDGADSKVVGFEFDKDLSHPEVELDRCRRGWPRIEFTFDLVKDWPFLQRGLCGSRLPKCSVPLRDSQEELEVRRDAC